MSEKLPQKSDVQNKYDDAMKSAECIYKPDNCNHEGNVIDEIPDKGFSQPFCIILKIRIFHKDGKCQTQCRFNNSV